MFTILKFRTMEAGPHSDWTNSGDDRITPFGRILRRTHLDELPQAINILRGDLSIVGPRPEQPQYVEELTDKIPFYDLRHVVRPGLTGWAQVKFGYAGDERDALEKLQYDFFYLQRQTLGLDVRIVARTVRDVRRGWRPMSASRLGRSLVHSTAGTAVTRGLGRARRHRHRPTPRTTARGDVADPGGRSRRSHRSSARPVSSSGSSVTSPGALSSPVAPLQSWCGTRSRCSQPVWSSGSRWRFCSCRRRWESVRS